MPKRKLCTLADACQQSTLTTDFELLHKLNRSDLARAAGMSAARHQALTCVSVASREDDDGRTCGRPSEKTSLRSFRSLTPTEDATPTGKMRLRVPTRFAFLSATARDALVLDRDDFFAD